MHDRLTRLPTRQIRTIQGLDVWALPTTTLYAYPFPPVYSAPAFEGDTPAERVEDGKLYTGSCHCGAVRLALHSKPLDESFPERIAECDCSVCIRVSLLSVSACVLFDILKLRRMKEKETKRSALETN